MEKLYSIRPNLGIMSLIAEIIELERSNNDTTRIAIFERAVAEAKKQNNWQKVYDTEIEENKSVEVPESFQVKADENDIDFISKKILSNIDSIKKPRMVFIAKLILCNYLLKLREKASLVGVVKDEKVDISASEMIKLLVEVLIMNRGADFELIEEIKEKLIEWRTKIYGNDYPSI